MLGIYSVLVSLFELQSSLSRSLESFSLVWKLSYIYAKSSVPILSFEALCPKNGDLNSFDFECRCSFEPRSFWANACDWANLSLFSTSIPPSGCWWWDFFSFDSLLLEFKI